MSDVGNDKVEPVVHIFPEPPESVFKKWLGWFILIILVIVYLLWKTRYFDKNYCGIQYCYYDKYLSSFSR